MTEKEHQELEAQRARKWRLYNELNWARRVYLDVTDGRRSQFIKVSKKELSEMIQAGFDFDVERITKMGGTKEIRFSFFTVRRAK